MDNAMKDSMTKIRLLRFVKAIQFLFFEMNIFKANVLKLNNYYIRIRRWRNYEDLA
ncbi:MAG: hypothetical protein ACJAS3_003661 [Roseivirga sp.]|jgi:hypothetical protein